MNKQLNWQGCFNTCSILWNNHMNSFPNKMLTIHDNGGVTLGNECVAMFPNYAEAKKCFGKAGYKVRRAPKHIGTAWYYCTPVKQLQAA